jgi:hypothetical protein
VVQLAGWGVIVALTGSSEVLDEAVTNVAQGYGLASQVRSTRRCRVHSAPLSLLVSFHWFDLI